MNMRGFAWALFGFIAATVQATDRQSNMEHINRAKMSPQAEFQQWVVKHGKGYIDDEEEYNMRFQIWQDNLEFVHGYNSPDKTHWIGMNSLADLTLEEYRYKYLGYDGASASLKVSESSADCMYCSIDIDDLPESVDMREKGVVTVIKNQAQCGSCWAFSAIAAVESINALYGEPLVSLSEQEVMDCDAVDDSCEGGLMDNAFDFVIGNGGVDTLEDYQYIAEDEKCDVNKEGRKVVTIQGYQDVPKNNETALMQAAANQVIAIAIEADQMPFFLYVGGIFDDECGTILDHGVDIVGYGVDEDFGVDYWIIRNSWGIGWGDNGYIKMRKDIETPEGMCGLAMQPSFPIKTEPNPPLPPPVSPSPSPSPVPASPVPPVQCNQIYTCNAGSTCCCEVESKGVCIQYGCCPIMNAVCCSDNVHCCPEDTMCDMIANSCVPKPNVLGAVFSYKQVTPLLSKYPAHVLEF
eukprot:TRINITY_DN2750_c2_g1_i1.p2 TRINITY_DN2750_c2_g1~~TRINITY_DN2750_c2_g1_i1.p2  ORF type:complete len:465 (-),score=50.01 TRINITY_DN2750_c2_g1_i1:323-1717(-)